MDERRQHPTLRAVPISAHADDRWRLTDPYVEQVWSKFLGPTATLLARRFGRLIEEHPLGVDLDLGDLAAGFGVQPSIAAKALDRLHRFEIVHFSVEASIVGVSGFAPSVQSCRLRRLSERGRAVHDRLVAQLEASGPAPGSPGAQAAASGLVVAAGVSGAGRAL